MQLIPSGHARRRAATWVASRSIFVALVAYAFIGFGGLWAFTLFVLDSVWRETFAMFWWLPAGYCALRTMWASEAMALRIARGNDDDAGNEGSMCWPGGPLGLPASARKRYRVYAYDVSEEPAGKPPTHIVGEFDDAAAALACAQSIVDRELEHVAPSCRTASELIQQFGSFGEGAVIDGDPAVSFNPYAYAAEHAQQWINQSRHPQPPEAEKPTR